MTLYGLPVLILIASMHWFNAVATTKSPLAGYRGAFALHRRRAGRGAMRLLT